LRSNFNGALLRKLAMNIPFLNRPPFQTGFAVVLGTNEIASAIAVYLHRSGWGAVLSHDPYPPVIRRCMSFHDTLFGDAAEVEGVRGAYAERSLDLGPILMSGDCVAVTRLGLLDLIPLATIHLLIDARMQKHAVTPDLRHLALLTIGVGPEFSPGSNCDIAIETHPSKNGTILASGRTDEADGVARVLGGVGGERFVYSDFPGRWHCAVDIGTRVYKNFTIGLLDGAIIGAPFDGILRGVVRDSTEVPAGVKLLEIDPRGREACWTGIDERGRAIAEATMKAIGDAATRKVAFGAFASAG
jgi:xanthine dehydrogenase accessory factor